MTSERHAWWWLASRVVGRWHKEIELFERLVKDSDKKLAIGAVSHRSLQADIVPARG